MDRETTPPRGGKGQLADWVALVGVVVLALATGGWLFSRYWPHADELWWGTLHDRNLHYLQGLILATGAKNLDLFSVFNEFDKFRVWGIVHPVLVAAEQLMLGIDHRTAVLPSLIMFVLTAVFAFLLARRVVDKFGNVAGAFAAVLVLTSPAHRAYATDVMLESSGAALSLATLYCYVVCVQEGTRRAALWLTASMLLLFFTKYNYWLIVFMAMVANEVLRQRAAILVAARAHWRERGKFLRQMLKLPFLLPAVVLFAVGFFMMKHGALSITIGGKVWTLNKPHVLFEIGWGFVCVQWLAWYWREGRRLMRTWDATYRVTSVGFGVVVGAWFLLPARLGSFLLFLSPMNTDQGRGPHPPFHGVPFYWDALRHDYSTSDALLVVVLLLAAVMGLRLQRVRGGGGVVLLFFVIAAALACNHPMLKNRFVHSWVAGTWVAAGAGVAMALAALPAMMGRVGAVAAVGGAAALAGTGLLALPHAQEGGVHIGSVPVMRLTAPYLEALKPGESVQIVCTEAQSFGLHWTYIERFRTPRNIDLDIPRYESPQSDPAALKPWLARTKFDAIVVVELSRTSPFFGLTGELDLKPLNEMLEQDSRYGRVEVWRMEHGERVTLWRKKDLSMLGSLGLREGARHFGDGFAEEATHPFFIDLR